MPSAIRRPPPAAHFHARRRRVPAAALPAPRQCGPAQNAPCAPLDPSRRGWKPRVRSVWHRNAARSPPPPRAIAPPARAAPRPAPRACAPPACLGVRCTGTRAETEFRCVRTNSSVSSNSASVSVGKPAIRSAPMAMPGRNARARSTTEKASARECRRCIRFRIRSLPACSERCRCGISRGSPSRRRHRSASIAAGSSEDSRSRGKSGTSASSRRTICPSVGAPGRSGP